MIYEFLDLVDDIARRVPAGLGYTVVGAGEQSDFVRFTQGRVRQPGSVQQGRATVRLVDGSRHVATTFTLSGHGSTDRQRAQDAVAQLTALLPEVPEDPHLQLASTPQSSDRQDPVALPAPEDVVDAVCREAAGSDLVGIYAQGTLWRGFANHLGQRNTFTSGSALLDYSLVHSADRAVKRRLGGKTWDPEALTADLAAARLRLEALKRPSRRVPPGVYRAWLEPAAVAELIGLMGMDGFSARSHRLGSGCMNPLVRGERALSPAVTLTEDTAHGLGPSFQDEGFIKPDVVPLVVAGRIAEPLVSPRTAAKYGLVTNGADPGEQPCALSLAPGSLPTDEALAALGTGVWVSNLWYLNFSDRNAARVTGMTRFATFWAEDGRLVAPLEVMRFDASLFDLLGSDLEALGSEATFLPSASTYEARSTDSDRCPGMLVRALPFTL